jgi:hypothetical protein
MKSFIQYIREEAGQQQYGKLKHLEHAEDHPFKEGVAGFHRAVNTLTSVHEALKGKDNGVKITTKYDGAPSIVFGHHPQTGRFFVATKSAFNKDPKINYSHEDIERNHGHAPGLVEKLKHAIDHLPKVAPKEGVYQGDMMYSGNDVREEKGKYHFTPNTITYSTPKNSEHGKKIAESKMGVVVHTKYHGPTLEDMSAGFDVDSEKFRNHPDVHVINHEIDHKGLSHPAENQRFFESHMEHAHDAMKRGGEEMLHAVNSHDKHLSTYINHTVRTGETPSAEGFKKHVETREMKELDKLKSEKGKAARQEKINAAMKHIEDNKHHFNTAFQLHNHLQKAKDHLIKSLNANQEFEHSIAGGAANPEGFVATHNGHPMKLVDRAEFSRSNFANPPENKFK